MSYAYVMLWDYNLANYDWDGEALYILAWVLSKVGWLEWILANRAVSF